jgi:hypothetical protein
MSKLLAGILILLAASGCGKSGKIGAIPEGSGTVKPAPASLPRTETRGAVRHDGGSFLTVGEHGFSEADVALREKVIRFKYGTVADIRVKAISQLVSGYLLVSVLEAMGKPVTYEILDEEVKRIDKQTQAPSDLKKIKKIFDGETGGKGVSGKNYALIFVLPDFANRKYYYDVFPKEKGLQKDRLMEAQNVLRELRAAGKPDFAAVAKKRVHWKHDETLFRWNKGFHRKPRPGEPKMPETKNDILPKADDNRWTRMEKELFAKTDRGKPVDQVVELETVFLILRWTGWEDEKRKVRKVERLILPKLSPHEHFEERIRKIPVRLADPKLRKTFQEKISWAGTVKWGDEK